MQIWAHRGASAVAPENTMAAFEAALKLGADAIELDVHRTSDHVLVVIHDETVTRTTQGRGSIATASLAFLQTLDAGYKFGVQFIGEKIPRLDDVLDFIKSTHLLVNIELKTNKVTYPGLEKQVVELIKEMHMQDRVVLSSFNYQSLRRVQALQEGLQTAMLCSEFRAIAPQDAKRFGAFAVHPAVSLISPMYMQQALQIGVAVRPYTVDDPMVIKQLASMGVDAVITNHPLRAKTALSS